MSIQEDIYGMTLEEAIAYCVPQGWNVVVHQYDDEECDIEKQVIKKDNISLNIQDGKVEEVKFFCR
jgi:hypothetical protein